MLSLCHPGCPFLLQNLFAHHQQHKDLQPPVRGSSLTLALNLDNELEALHSNLAEFTIDNMSASDLFWHKAQPWQGFQAVISEEEVIVYD